MDGPMIESGEICDLGSRSDLSVGSTGRVKVVVDKIW